MTTGPVINLADVPLQKNGNGEGFEAEIGSFGRLIGSTGIGCMLHVVQPGKKAFPRHAHHQIHELFVILEGEGVYRFGDEAHPVKAGDVCAAPTGGPETAHQIANTGSVPLKYLGVSTVAETEVVEYPDSDKFAVMSRFDWATMSGGIRSIGRTKDSLGYYDGEE
ncbi:cupin domain-containing protein [Oricola cellulosilytica]|uniref:Cupin domain-containing protein n=1 Tax=Oricola cellulosilytica TaxID=1429082 RepID=A0A4V2MND5_9HYPH|nr:cupin domain-containing protein [Oricola cellulosilytica]TCD12410.1 cupin domain-containing protein [Oricola cellulosilytica]